MTHIRGAPRHPQTQGKIERWHQTLKNRILLEHHYLPGALEEQVAAFVQHCNHARAHESLGNLTPADVSFGRGEAILAERERIKKQTLTQRVSVRPDRVQWLFQGRSSSILVILWSGMRASVSASQAWGSTPLSLAVSIKV